MLFCELDFLPLYITSIHRRKHLIRKWLLDANQHELALEAVRLIVSKNGRTWEKSTFSMLKRIGNEWDPAWELVVRSNLSLDEQTEYDEERAEREEERMKNLKKWIKAMLIRRPNPSRELYVSSFGKEILSMCNKNEFYRGNHKNFDHKSDRDLALGRDVLSMLRLGNLPVRARLQYFAPSKHASKQKSKKKTYSAGRNAGAGGLCGGCQLQQHGAPQHVVETVAHFLHDCPYTLLARAQSEISMEASMAQHCKSAQTLR